jgi:phosphocarrier protein HPr
LTREYEVQDKIGLHARPAAQWVKAVARIKGPVTIRSGETVIDGKSILQVMALGMRPGAILTVTFPDDLTADMLQEIDDAVKDFLVPKIF